MPDCPCGGTNPNCFRCWGKGWYGSDNKKSKLNKKVKIVVFKGNSIEERKLVICPICACQVEKDLYDVHLATHTRRVDELRNKELIQCSICSAMIRKDRMQKHLRKVHDADGGDQEKRHLNSKEIIQCSLCASKVRSDRMQRHLRKVHGVDGDKNTKQSISDYNLSKNINNTRKKRFNRTTAVSMSSNHRDKVNNFDDNCHHDSTFGGKDLGYFARDNGQFGSLPLYDDYSEESDAD